MSENIESRLIAAERGILTNSRVVHRHLRSIVSPPGEHSFTGVTPRQIDHFQQYLWIEPAVQKIMKYVIELRDGQCQATQWKDLPSYIRGVIVTAAVMALAPRMWRAGDGILVQSGEPLRVLG